MTEAKAMLPHGKWGEWLKEKVDFEKSTAANLMKIYDEYSKSDNIQAFGNLTYSKAVLLAPLPGDVREEFVQHHDVENMTTRELERAIKESEELRTRLAQEEDRKKEIESALNESKDRVLQAESRVRDAEKKVVALEKRLNEITSISAEKDAKIKDLTEHPVVSDDVLNKIKADASSEARDKLQKEIEKNKKNLEESLKEQEFFKSQAESYRIEIEEMQKKIKMSNADVVEFKTLFDRFQKDYQHLISVISRVESVDKDSAVKLTNALKAFFERVVK